MVLAPLSFKKNNIHIKRDNILKGMNVPLDFHDPYTNSLIDNLITESLELCNPQVDIAIFENPIFIDKQEVEFNNQHFHLGKIVQNALKNSSQMALFACTAGNGVEHYSKQFINKGEALEGLIVDLIGSEIAEETAEITHQYIHTEMHKLGLQTTNRYSPGYCNWPVSDQQKVFTLLQTTNSNIQLTASSLMMPIKSVSGIIGIGKDIKNRPYNCVKCDTNFCIYRDKQ